MPFTAEAPSPVKAKPVSNDPFERSALAGRSPLEAAQDKPAVVKPDEDEFPDVGAMDTSALKQAQAKDAATKSGKAAVDPDGTPHGQDYDPKEGWDSIAKQDAKPIVPNLPTQEEWRPKGEKAGKQWDDLKAKHTTEAAALKAEVERTKAELAAARDNGDPEEVKSIKAQLKQYQELIREVAIERDPGFKQKFEPREKTAIDAAKLAAGDKGAKLETLLKSPSSPWRDEQINAIKDELSDSSKMRIDSALRMLDQIDLEKQSEIAVQRSQFEHKHAATVSQQREQQAARMKEFSSSFESTLKEWTDPAAGHPFLIERSGDEAYNKEVAASKALASNLHQSFIKGEMEPADFAKAMLHVAVAERTLKASQEYLKRAEKAERALAKIRGAQPGDGRNGQPEAEVESAGPGVGTAGYMKWLNTELKARQERDLAARRGQ